MKALSRLLFLAAFAVACGGGRTEEAPAPPAPPANPVDPATAGRITGAIRLEGTPPAAAPIAMQSDPYCAKLGERTTQTYVTGTGGPVSRNGSAPFLALQNVFVYVKDGLGDARFPVPTTPVVLGQEDCWYVPRVMGVQVGQNFDILSSDDTLHNVHAIPEHNREFNKAHQSAGVRHTHVFSAREVMVPFKCDVHKWMHAWVGVLDHPFFAVSGEGGAFEITGLPPGTYTIEAWHEALGTATQTVTIGAKETADITFTFKV
jgi:hypothetical protein